MKKLYNYTLNLLLLLLPGLVLSGSLDSPAPPNDPNSAMYTLTDLCNRLEQGTEGEKRLTFNEPLIGPSPTGCTLNEIMAKMPKKEDLDGAQPGDVIAGKKYWGLVNGYWGVQTGTSTAVDTQSNNAAIAQEILSGKKVWVNGTEITGTMPTQTLSADEVNLNEGFYEATTLTAVDKDLAPENLKQGITIFGITGNSNIVDTRSGNAAAEDLKMGKKAWVNGVEITGTYIPLILEGNVTPEQVLENQSFSNAHQIGLIGTMPNQGAQTYIPTLSDQMISQGYHNGLGLVKGDSQLISDNIKSGITLFGVIGDPNVVDTEPANATAIDLNKDKTAFIKGQLITGTRYPTPIAKTGQVTSYEAGDDGTLQTGISWPTERFTDNNDGTITDNLTGLIWLKNANCIQDNLDFDTDSQPDDARVTWSQALDFITNLNNSIYSCNATQTDWRLPNVKELLSLIDFSKIQPALPAGYPFENIPFFGVTYWSSTTDLRKTEKAVTVRIDYGYVSSQTKTFTSYVWPVREGQ